MEISESLICLCNQKCYKNTLSLKAHRKTQAHLYWEQNKEQKEISIKINKLENENDHLRRLNIILMERISDLEKIIN
jgi:hypothetical protein